MDCRVTKRVFDEKMDALIGYFSLPGVQARSPHDYTLEEYREVVNLGPAALKHLRGLIGEGKDQRLRRYVLAACCDILGSEGIDRRPHFPEEIRGDLGEMEAFMKGVVDDFVKKGPRGFDGRSWRNYRCVY